MIKSKKFEILIASPPEYENLVAEIYFDGLFFVTISRDDSSGHFQIETPPGCLVESEIARKVDLEGFVDAIRNACDRLYN